MTMREHIGRIIIGGLLLCCFGPGPSLHAQTYRKFLDNPILTEAERHSMMFGFVERNLPPLETPTTLAAWEAGKPKLVQQILKLVGLPDLDSRGPIKWQSKGTIDRTEYTIEKIIFESYPGMMVPALVYTPKGLTAPAPAMVSITGHAYCDGKALLSVQARCVNLVRRGFIVIVYEYLMTFERNTGADPCAGMPYGGGNDHGLSSFSYSAGTPTALEILDGIRAIDYLYTRKDVDRSRVGFTGESGGGNSTYWVAALDSRVRLAVSVVAVTSFDYWILNDRDWDWHQRPPGIRRLADVGTLLSLVAPRPLLVINSKRGTDSDDAPFEQAAKAVRQASKVYELYGKPADIQLWESSTSHGYQEDKREKLYAWVENYFLGQPREVSPEMPFVFEPQSQLKCGLPADNKTFADIYEEWLRIPTALPDIPANADAARTVQQNLRERLRELLGLMGPAPTPTFNVDTLVGRDDVLIRRLIIQTAPGINLPAVEISSRKQQPRATVVFVGKSPEFYPAIPFFLSSGLRIVMSDVRGIGEIDSGGTRTDNWAWLVGRTWPGMWVEDINGIIASLAAEFKGTPTGLMASSRMGKPALFAAALNPQIAALVAQLPYTSYREEASKHSLADVPRILSALDLPAIAALVAPRPCWLQPPEDVDDHNFQSTYAWTTKFYERPFTQKAALRLSGDAKASWKEIAEWFKIKLVERSP